MKKNIRLVLLGLIERIETNLILIKTNFAGIANATTNKFNAEQDQIWPMQPIKVWQNKSTITSLLIVLSLSVVGQNPEFQFSGIKIKVSDLDKAYAFYSDVLEFEVEKFSTGLKIVGQSVDIEIKEAPLKNQSKYPLKSRTSLSLQVDKLLPAIDKLRGENVYFYDTLLVRNGVGISIPFQDPSGNVMSLIEVQVFDAGPINGFRVYNSGVTIANMDKAISFYEEVLGFKEWSRKYLPGALPLKHNDGSFAFMIHFKRGLEANDQSYLMAPNMSLMITTNDMNGAKKHLERHHVKVEEQEKKLVCQDPEGNWIEIVKM